VACAGSIVNATPVFLSRVVSGMGAMTQDFLKHENKLFFFLGGVETLCRFHSTLYAHNDTRGEENKIGDMNVHVPQTTSS
jgi:hypothetical protein